MKERLITFSTIKLAKEKGFEISNYIKLGELKQPHNWHKEQLNTNEFWYFNISQSILQKWLRDVHNMHILMNVGMHDSIKQTFYCNVFLFGVNLYKGKFRSKTSIYTYEEALEKGLQAALKLI